MVDWEAFYSSFRSPDFISGYEIENHLGGGAFGEVYKAKKSSIGKAYAIKFLRLDEEAQKGAVERELDQVRLFAAIDHPNLVTMEDMGVVEGVPYLIMGYAGEDTLARHLRKGDLDRERALRYFVQACRGVLALHDRRLAHFDLKPSNIFLRGDIARVGDYGLAKLLVEGRQTLSFGRGTPQYMAPEMLKSRADHRADLYSLGVILYECLTGKLPYAQDAGSGMIVREEDVPPDFPDEFPADLEPVVTRLLRLVPADRYAGVPELLEDLGQTARQGDSVRIRFDALPPDTRALQTQSGAAAEDAPTPVPGAEPDSKQAAELKQAAAELARGAVGVAKGVWDGVIERVSKSTRDGPERAEEKVDALEKNATTRARELVEGMSTKLPRGKLTAKPPGKDAGKDTGEIGGDVVSFGTLDDAEDLSVEELETSAQERALSPPEAPWRRELERVRGERQEEPELLAQASASSILRLQATVPVPPRAEGGLIGNVVQSAVVGGEIMGALVTGPFLVLARGTVGAFDRVLSGVSGPIKTILRLLMMLILMALLGGLVAFVFLAALSMKP